MKIKYFYQEQLRKTLKHLVRVFSEFQVQSGFDANGDPTYKRVPCRYLNQNKFTSYMINGGSENLLPSAPLITISIQSFKMNRKEIRGPVTIDTIMGTNVSPEVNKYTKELDEQFHIKRINPIPWDLTINVNIWCTTLTSKLELLEQIITLFDPSVDFQTSENPLDWTSLTVMELTDCEFSTLPVPLGTSTEWDIAKLTFKLPVWMSLPAVVTKPKLIEQIVTNIHTARDEMDIDLDNYQNITTDVYTPRNMCISTNRVFNSSNTERYELTLLDSSLSDKTSNGQIYSWDKYLKYLDPNSDTKDLYIKFLSEIEDQNALNANVISIGSGNTANKMIVEIETSLTVKYGIKQFIVNSNPIKQGAGGDYFINALESEIDYNGVKIPAGYVVKLNEDKHIDVYPPVLKNEYIYNSDDSSYYRYNSTYGWIQLVMARYKPGFWRIAFKDN